jgi:hypothetical protein
MELRSLLGKLHPKILREGHAEGVTPLQAIVRAVETAPDKNVKLVPAPWTRRPLAERNVPTGKSRATPWLTAINIRTASTQRPLSAAPAVSPGKKPGPKIGNFVASLRIGAREDGAVDAAAMAARGVVVTAKRRRNPALAAFWGRFSAQSGHLAGKSHSLAGIQRQLIRRILTAARGTAADADDGRSSSRPEAVSDFYRSAVAKSICLPPNGWSYAAAQ